MKTTTLLLGSSALAFLLIKKPKKLVKKEDDYPGEEQVMINEENISHYFREDPVFLKDIPGIYEEIPTQLQKYINSEYPYQEDDDYWVKEPLDGAFVYVDADIATAIWDLGLYYFKQDPDKYKGSYPEKNAKQFGDLVNLVLKDSIPDVYWKEGLSPYNYKSQFWYVWVSAKYLLKFAKIVALDEDWTFAPGNIEDDS